MNRATLRKLAELTASENEVGGRVADFVLTKLSKSDLRAYLFYLRREIAARKVTVRTPGTPDPAVRAKLAALFRDRTVVYETEPALIGGMQVEAGDTIVDLSVRSLVERTYTKIKESL